MTNKTVNEYFDGAILIACVIFEFQSKQIKLFNFKFDKEYLCFE